MQLYINIKENKLPTIRFWSMSEKIEQQDNREQSLRP